MRAFVLVVILAGGCEAKRWNDHAITSVELGPFKAPIPAGWRDTSEYADQTRLPKTPAGARVIMPEAVETSSGFQSNVVAQWLAVSDRDLPCDVIGDRIAKTQSAVRTQTAEAMVGTDRVCAWSATEQNAATTSWYRVHGDHALYVQCTHADAGLSPEGERGCATFWASLAVDRDGGVAARRAR